jgi:hypothetical protein
LAWDNEIEINSFHQFKMQLSESFKYWPEIIPVLSAGLLFVLLKIFITGSVAGLAFATMMLAVIASVHHAEVIAHRLVNPMARWCWHWLLL